MTENNYQKLKQLTGFEILENELLSKHTNYQIGGPADYFFECKENLDLAKICEVAHELKIPYFILGGGSNILILDKGFRGLVIKTTNKNIEYRDDQVIVDSGFVLMDLVNKLANAGLSGLEFGTGIYGTVGGAVRGNAGSYGGEIKDILESCEVVVPGQGIKIFTNEQCKFVYRGSIFKDNPEMVVLKAIFNLVKTDPNDVKEKIKEYAKKKYGAQPMQYPSSGCIFKNPQVNKKDLERLAEHFDDFKNTSFWQSGSVGAGYLIDKAGLKGKKIGGAQVSEEHASFIINTGGATSENILTLISYIKQQVRDKYGVQLQEEIQIVGEY